MTTLKKKNVGDGQDPVWERGHSLITDELHKKPACPLPICRVVSFYGRHNTPRVLVRMWTRPPSTFDCLGKLFSQNANGDNQDKGNRHTVAPRQFCIRPLPQIWSFRLVWSLHSRKNTVLHVKTVHHVSHRLERISPQ